MLFSCFFHRISTTKERVSKMCPLIVRRSFLLLLLLLICSPLKLATTQAVNNYARMTHETRRTLVRCFFIINSLYVFIFLSVDSSSSHSQSSNALSERDNNESHRQLSAAVRSLFASLGTVDSCKLVKDKLSGQSLGYAFVAYERRDEADTAVRTLNGTRLQNKTIKV